MSNILDEALEIIIINAYMDSGDLGELNAKYRSIIEKALELGKSYNQLLSKIQQVFEREVDGYILSLAEIDKRYNEIYSLLKELLENE